MFFLFWLEISKNKAKRRICLNFFEDEKQVLISVFSFFRTAMKKFSTFAEISRP